MTTTEFLTQASIPTIATIIGIVFAKEYSNFKRLLKEIFKTQRSENQAESVTDSNHPQPEIENKAKTRWMDKITLRSGQFLLDLFIGRRTYYENIRDEKFIKMSKNYNMTRLNAFIIVVTYMLSISLYHRFSGSTNKIISDLLNALVSIMQFLFMFLFYELGRKGTEIKYYLKSIKEKEKAL